MNNFDYFILGSLVAWWILLGFGNLIVLTKFLISSEMDTYTHHKVFHMLDATMILAIIYLLWKF